MNGSLYTLRALYALGLGTFLGALRNRILLVALFFGVALVGLSVSAASVSILERGRIIIDIGLAASSGLVALITIALTINTIAADLKSRTAYTVLVRPLPRWIYVLGRFLGIYATMALVMTLMYVSTAITLWFFGAQIPAAFWASYPLLLLETLMVSALATFFAGQTEVVLAAGFSIGLWIAGGFSADILALAIKLQDKGASLQGLVMQATYYILPDLGALSLRSQAANALAVPDGYLGHAFIYAMAYTVFLLTAAMLVFSRRRDF